MYYILVRWVDILRLLTRIILTLHDEYGGKYHYAPVVVVAVVAVVVSMKSNTFG